MPDSLFTPSTVHQIKVFEAIEVTSPRDGGYRRIDAWCTRSLEDQIQRWIRETGSVIVPPPGPVTLAYYREDFDPQTAKRLGVDHMRVETRTLAVTYVPALQEGEQLYGQPLATYPATTESGGG